MARSAINNGETGFSVRTKLNNMTDELYTEVSSLKFQLADKADSTHNHDTVYAAVGHNHDAAYAPAGHDHAGIYEPADAAIQAHVTAPHAPSDAQKNSNILKAEIEAKLTGEIGSHGHAT